jgi:hypothetical protein
MITHFGTHDFIELPTPQTYTPATGITRQRRFRMLKTSVPGFTATLTAQGYAWEVSPDEASPFSVVTTIASPELTTTWTLDGNDMEKPLWMLPKVREMFDRMPDLKKRAKIKADIEGLVRGEYTNDARKTVQSIKNEALDAMSTLNPDGNSTQPIELGNTDDIIDGIIKSLVKGVEAWPTAAFVLRKTMVLPPLTNVSPGFANCNKVFTLAALVREEPMIPLNISGELLTLGGYWQKKTPQASQAADGRWTYTVEYWYAEEVDRFIYQVIE